MKKVKLGEVIYLNMGQSPESDSYNSERQGIPFFQGNADFGKINPLVRLWCNKPTKIAKKNDILLSVRAPIGAINIANCECCIGRGLCAITPREKIISSKYLYFGLMGLKNYLISKGTGSTFKAINKNILLEAEIPLPSVEEQKEIADRLDKVSSLIEKRKTQLSKLDQLIKSRFFKMFGDPTITDKNKSYKPMTSICEIIDGDRGKNYPKQEEFYEDGYCLFLNAKNVTSNGFDFTNCMFITKDKDELLHKGKLNRGDVVLTTRGTIGNLAYYSDDVLFDNVRINSGMVILRMNHEVIDEIFFIEQFKLQLAEIKEKIASGSAQPQLPISTMNKIQMLVPKISKQIDFTNFVEQTDKSKLAIQKSIDKLETLKKSLMQQYFG